MAAAVPSFPMTVGDTHSIALVDLMSSDVYVPDGPPFVPGDTDNEPKLPAWSCSDSTVVGVSAETSNKNRIILTALKAGNATVTAVDTATNTATFSVTVNAVTTTTVAAATILA